MRLRSFGFAAVLLAVATTNPGRIFFKADGTGSATRLLAAKLGDVVSVDDYAGVDACAKIQAAHDNGLPATGGVIWANELTGAQTCAAGITITKPIRLMLGAAQFSMGTNQVVIRANGVTVEGVGITDENNSPTRFIYTGTASAMVVANATTATPIFGTTLTRFEIDALGGAISSATAAGITFLGGRYMSLDSISIYNFQQGAALVYGGNGGPAGFGGTNHLKNVFLSTNRTGVKCSNISGSESTHGMFYGGAISSGSLTGTVYSLDLACESWRVYGTDIGAQLILRGTGNPANDFIGFGLRFEGPIGPLVTIQAGVNRASFVAPSFINLSGTAFADSGTGTSVYWNRGRQTLTYAATIAVDLSLAGFFEVSPTDGVAFTISNPSNMVDGTTTTFTIRNAFGVLGAANWGTAYHLAGAWVQPANGFRRSVTFTCVSASTCFEVSRTAADVGL